MEENMRLRFVSGVVVSACAVACAVYLSGGRVVPGYVALDLALITLLPLGAAMAAFGPRAVGRAFTVTTDSIAAGASERRDAALRDAALRDADVMLRWLARATWLAMAAGFLLIQIWMMYDLQDPSALFDNLALSLEPPILGFFVIYCVYRPLRHAVLNGLERETPEAGAAPARGASPIQARTRWSLVRWAAGIVVMTSVLAAWNLVAYGRIGRFVDLAPLSLALFLPLGQLLAGPGPNGLRSAFAALSTDDPSALRSARRIFAFNAGSFAVAAALAFSLGAAYFLEAIGDRMRYGPTLALAELGLLQSAVLALVLALPPLAAADRALAAADRALAATEPNDRGGRA